MGRGFLSGVISGSLIGALVLALLSLFSPLPHVDVDEAATPAEQEEPEGEAVAEEEADPIAEPEAEPADEPEPEPEPETEPAEEPETSEPEAAPEAEATPEPEVEAGPEAAEPSAETTEEPAQDVEQAPTEEAPAEIEDPATEDGSALEIEDAEEAVAEAEPEAATEAPAVEADLAQDVEETADDLASRLAARLAAEAEDAADVVEDATVAVTDAEPDLPQAPAETSTASLADTLAELAPAPETLNQNAPAAPEPVNPAVDVSVFSAPAPASDEVDAAEDDQEFGLPQVLNFDGQAPSYDGPITQPGLSLELSADARSHENTQPAEPSVAASEAPAADIAPEPETKVETVVEAETERSSSDDIIAEVNTLINEPKPVVSTRLPQMTDDVTEVGAATQDEVASDEPINNRLPTLADELNAETASKQEAAVEAEAPAVTQLDPNEVGALRAFAADAPTPTDLPKISVILIDAGDLGIATTEIIAQPFPATLAIRTGMSNGQAKLRTYRTAGIEVLTMTDDLPRLADPSDVQVALAAYFDRYRESIGVLDPLDRRIQSNRALLGPVLDGVKTGGFGFVSYEQGLNSAQQEAERRDVPAASIFRILDAELEDSAKIKRYLDRAAFTATQQGHAVVLGHSYRETVDAISSWAKDNEFNFSFVPVSSILLEGAES